jgi:hypothetical protein
MDTSFALRIDATGKQWGGKHSPQGDKHSRRRQKLMVLLECLKAGELDAARLAFTALVNFDPTVSFDPYLSKLGAALQSSNLYAAQHFGLEIQRRGWQLQSNKLLDDAQQDSKRSSSMDVQSVIKRIDLSA